ncbi:glycosyltransferase [Paracoccus sp. 11-3]|uniref:Glycosyltransferase n=1 Tax=Paracoccus amoyensis TaxID=2760093 RepID=A0A926GA55_9RHOB|nr:glycosyltransferase [Paracoccus amoyensis]MBC9247263.1 glycosyltransferase [Paracoccus amoyensis]
MAERVFSLQENLSDRDKSRGFEARLPAARAAHSQQRLGRILLEDNAVDSGNLLKAVVMRQRQKVRLGQILLSQGWVTPEALLHALSRQWRSSIVDTDRTPADPRLIDDVGAEFCLRHGILPWRRLGGITWVATSRPEAFADICQQLPAHFGHIRMLLCSEEQAQASILSSRRTALIRRAELRVPAHESCRTRNEGRMARLALSLMLLLAVGLWFAPVLILSLLMGWTALTLIAQSGLKLAAFIATLRQNANDRAKAEALAGRRKPTDEMSGPLPVISVMVPLFKEQDIAGKLVKRLARLDYPRELTDIILVIEADDDVTRNTLAATELPRWMRIVEVPPGPIQTKPRALNYALNFCRGEIVGIWDAEDRPDPDQLHKVARGFHFAPQDVACLQGVLDYYNPSTNWLSRCFTIEYAAWFRVLLPGVAKLGLVVPLGGTTLFFRRAALEAVDAWDAWNVTEDADLGVRLVRRGFRTEILDTTTNEEANCRALPWVKQRSRWLKGYAMTWGVHMRDPLALWRDLGSWRFLGFQIQFFGSVSQYLLAPLLWSFWLLPLGLPHPLRAPLENAFGGAALTLLLALFIASELLSIAVGLWAVRGSKHRHLLAWVPTLHLYFPLGCLAGWKAIYEVVARPFYWDKTQHGVFAPNDFLVQQPTPNNTIAVELIGQIGEDREAAIPLSDISDTAIQQRLSAATCQLDTPPRQRLQG